MQAQTPKYLGYVSLIREQVTAWTNQHTIDNTKSGRQEQREDPTNSTHDFFGLELGTTNIQHRDGIIEIIMPPSSATTTNSASAVQGCRVP